MIPARKLVVDASVVAKWYIPELGSAQAAALLDSGAELLAPDLLVAEVGNALWKRVGRGEITGSEAEERAAAFVSTSPVALRPARLLLGVALPLAIAYQRSLYDALYLALALAEGCPLVTADARLAHALHGTDLQRSVLLLTI